MNLFNKKSSNKNAQRRPQPVARSNAFSYYNGERNPSSPNTQPRYKESFLDRLKKLNWRGLPSLTLGLILIFCLLYMFVLNPSPRVNQLATANNITYHTQKEYETGAAKIMKRSIFNRNKLTINIAGFEKEFKKAFPEASDVNVALPVMGHRPTVTLEILPPAMILTSSNSSYVIDDSGRAVLSNTQAPSSLTDNLPVVVDASNVGLKDGGLVISSTDVAFIKDVASQFKAKNVPVQSFILPPVASELQVKPANTSYYIKFYLGGDARLQAGSFFAARNNLAGRGITPAEYIDVRVEEKVFYK